MTDVFLSRADSIGSTAQAAGFQSDAAWMFYLYDVGKWDASEQYVQKIADAIINMAIQYGVACCHHTCKNLEFNMKIIQASSLSPEKKAQYAEILATATLTDPLYVMDDAPVDGDGQSETKPTDQMVNGTTEENGQAAPTDAGGETAVGDQPSTSSQDASASSSQSSDASSSQDSSSDSSEDASQASDSKAYEVSKSSPAKSASSDSSMPIVVIIAVILLIVIFLVGYVRNNNDDFDDY